MKKMMIGIVTILLVITAATIAILGDFRGEDVPDDSYYAKLENQSTSDTYTITATNGAGYQLEFTLDSNVITKDMFDDGYIKISVNKNDAVLQVYNITEKEYILPTK